MASIFEEAEDDETAPALGAKGPRRAPKAAPRSAYSLCGVFVALSPALVGILVVVFIVWTPSKGNDHVSLGGKSPAASPVPGSIILSPTSAVFNGPSTPPAESSSSPTRFDPGPTTPPPTMLPTPLPVSPSLPPTAKPLAVEADGGPVNSLSDPRYGPEKIEFSKTRQDAWLALAAKRSNFGKSWKEIKADCDEKTHLLKNPPEKPPNQYYAIFRDCGDQLHGQMCDSLNASTPKLKYEEPDWAKANGADVQEMARHYRQHRAFLADYYELPQGLPQLASPGALKNLQAVFARALARKKLVLGFQGSSVMSGQDNCHYWIFSEVIKRHFTRILSPLKITVEVRNMGQNGDGPDQSSQLLCALDSLGDDVDIVTVWYPMMPPASPQEQFMFVRRWLARRTFVTIMTLAENDPAKSQQATTFKDYHLPFSQAWFDHPDIYNLAIHWGGGWEGGWSKHGDGRCHLVTRENMDGVWMWNWHFGPLGFQMLTDTHMNTYLHALERMLLDRTKPEDWDASLLPKENPKFERPWGLARYDHITPTDFRMACLTGYAPHFTPLADMAKTWYLPLTDTSNPFPKSPNAPEDGNTQILDTWSWVQNKPPSQGHTFQWEVPNTLVHTTECQGFADIGFQHVLSARSQSVGLYSEWLTFKVPKFAADRLAASAHMDVHICTSSRDTGAYGLDHGLYGKHPEIHIRYGVNGKFEGDEADFAEAKYVFASCFVAANAVKTVKEGDVFGFTVRKDKNIGYLPIIKTVLLVGLNVQAGADDGANSGTSPSAHPEDESPVSKMADPRYGPASPVFSALRNATWYALAVKQTEFALNLNTKVANATLNSKKLVLGFEPAPDQKYAVLKTVRDQLHAQMCANISKMALPLKYLEPDWSNADASRSSEMARHFRQHRAFLADYYRLFSGLPNPITPAGLKNLQAMFARAIAKKKLVLGFAGTSVMSGQDNCHYWIYSEQMKRQFEKILGAFKVAVEIRNEGQNGDGPDQATRLLCSPDTLGDDIDLLTVWYPMIEPATEPEHVMFLRRWISRKTFVHVMDLNNGEKLVRKFNKFAFQLDTSWFNGGWMGTPLIWTGGYYESWGAHGDGRCHLVTRENLDGVFMQNWHFGPMGFQMQIDTAMNTYMYALERLMVDGTRPDDWDGTLPLESQEERPWGLARYKDVTGADFAGACATGYFPQFTALADINNTWLLPADHPSNPFPKSPNADASVACPKWSYVFIKGSSHGWGVEQWNNTYTVVNDALCDGFPDKGWAFQASSPAPVGVFTDWLPFKIPKHAVARLSKFSKMDVLLCESQRDNGFVIRCPECANTTVVLVGLNGKPAAEATLLNKPYIFNTCVVAAKSVAAPKDGDVLGIAMQNSLPGSDRLPLFETLVLLGVRE